MMRLHGRSRRRVLLGLSWLLVSTSWGACGFADPITANPNTVAEPDLDQILAAATAVAWTRAAGGTWGAFWIQQLDGGSGNPVGRYEFQEADGWLLFSDTYGGGGLIDLRLGRRLAEARGHRGYAGVFKVLEAFLVGSTASLYGDIPYSEAADPDIDAPALDAQRDVYDQIQALLAEAVADLESGVGRAPTAADLFYGGDLSAWVAFAYTLEARYHLHWAEVDGDSRYAAALAAARNGVTDVSEEWLVDNQPPVETNPWWRLGSTAVAGKFLIDALLARSDPRLPLYFGEATGPYAGTYVGSHPDDSADPGAFASHVACGRGFESGVFCPLGTGYGSLDFAPPGVTCAENYFIMAEAEYQVGTEAGAITALDQALACEEQRKGVDLSATRAAVSALSGRPLLEEIMMQKYISLFMSDEVWNDYKRTCLPAVKPYADEQVPGRLLYPPESRTGNPNIPSVEEQKSDPYGRPLGANANDPNPCL